MQWVSSQQHLVNKIHEAIQRHIEGFVEVCSPIGGVTGFIDDITIYVDARIANLVIADVLDIYADAGIIKLNLSKGRFLERTGCIILGCPVRMPSYRCDAAITIVNKASRSLFSTITTLQQASTALALTRNCVSVIWPGSPNKQTSSMPSQPSTTASTQPFGASPVSLMMMSTA